MLDLFTRFGKMRVVVEMKPDGTFSALTAAPTCGYVEGLLTPEEALDKLYEKMDKANFFNNSTTGICRHKWQTTIPITMGQLKYEGSCITCGLQKTIK